MIPTETIDKLESIWRSVSALGAELDESEWKLPTDLAGWTVQDNLAHMIGTERMLQGLPPAQPPDNVGAHVKNPIGHFNEAEVEARRGDSGAEVLNEWNALADLRLATLHGADDEYFARYGWDWFPVVDDRRRFLGIVQRARAQIAIAEAADRGRTRAGAAHSDL